MSTHHRYTRCALPVALMSCALLILLAGCARGPNFQELERQIEAANREAAESIRLEKDLQRQKRLGRFDDAQQTAQKIEEREQERAEKCADYWRVSEEMKRLGDQGRYDESEKRRRQLKPEPAYECGQRRSEGEGPLEGVETARWQIENDTFGGREVLFVSPLQFWWMKDDEKFDRSLPEEAEKVRMESWARMSAKDFIGAAQSLERALILVRQLRGPEHPSTAPLLEWLGGMEELSGDPAAALRHYQSAVALLEKAHGANSPKLATALWHQASVFSDMGDSDRAIDAAERALSLVTTSGESSLAYAVALNNVGVALHHKGAIEKALRAYEKSLETFQEIIGLKEAPDDVAMAEFHMARIHSNLGLAYWGRGDPAQAYRHFRFAQEQMADEERVARTERGALAEMAELSVELDVFLTLERAMPALPGERIALQMLLERKGAVLEEQTRTMGGFRTAAEQSAPRSQSPRKSLADFFGFGTQERIVQQAEQLRQALRGDSPSEDREVMQEYETVLAQRSALEHLKTASPEEEAAKQRAATDLDTRIQAIQQHIQTRVESRELIQRRKAVGAPDPKALAEAMGNARTDAELDEIEKRHMAQLRSQAGVEQQRKRSERLALLQRIQSRIPDNSALLEMVQYWPFDPRADLPENRWGAARYGVYLIRRTGAPIYIDYGEAEPIDTLITEFRRSLVQPPWTLARDLGRRLDARLMQPVREHLDAMTQLLLAPEGLLNLIPFGALVDERDRYLIETFSFNYLASGRDLLRPEKHDKPRSPALIVADPNFDVEGPAIASAQPGPASTQAARSRNFSGIRFDSLPGTAAEARALKHILPDAVTLTGLQATETALKQIKGPRILHVATHGFFLEDQGTNPSEASRRRGNTGHTAENPMLRSGLAFTGANLFRSGNDDGILTALEAAGLDLVGTRLVVLSACDTGAGDVKNGEGVFGLRRAFVVAGAETILMSLFQVEDEATKSLMVDYYRRLAQGEGRTEALRQAQLAFLQDPAHRHPLFWASFISSGESGRM